MGHVHLLKVAEAVSYNDRMQLTGRLNYAG